MVDTLSRGIVANLLIADDDNIAINYYGGDKPQLEGWFFYKGAKGTVSVSK